MHNIQTSQEIRTLIIDDEQRARQNLQSLIKYHLPTVKVIGEAEDIYRAQFLVEELRPDLLFLDIQMPGGNGFQLLEALSKRDMRVIFVTAHENYAIQAIRAGAHDYLLKPVDIEELIDAVDGLDKLLKPGTEANLVGSDQPNEYTGYERFILQTTSGFRIVELNDIVRLEGDGGYTTFHFASGERVTETKTLKFFDAMMPEGVFLRCFQSHVINLNHVVEYQRGRGGKVKMSDGALLRVSRDRKDDLIAAMQERLRKL